MISNLLANWSALVRKMWLFYAVAEIALLSVFESRCWAQMPLFYEGCVQTVMYRYKMLGDGDGWWSIILTVIPTLLLLTISPLTCDNYCFSLLLVFSMMSSQIPDPLLAPEIKWFSRMLLLTYLSLHFGLIGLVVGKKLVFCAQKFVATNQHWCSHSSLLIFNIYPFKN